MSPDDLDHLDLADLIGRAVDPDDSDEVDLEPLTPDRATQEARWQRVNTRHAPSTPPRQRRS